MSKNRVYTLKIKDNVSEVLDHFELADSLLLDHGVPDSVKFDEKKAIGYLRGAFLSSGSVTNPENGKYHLKLPLIMRNMRQICSIYLKPLASEVR